MRAIDQCCVDVSCAEVQRLVEGAVACGFVSWAEDTAKAHGTETHFAHHGAALAQLPLFYATLLNIDFARCNG